MAVFVQFYTRSHECVSPCASITYNSSTIIDEFSHQIQLTVNSTLSQQLTQRPLNGREKRNELQFPVYGSHDPAKESTTPAHVIM